MNKTNTDDIDLPTLEELRAIAAMLERLGAQQEEFRKHLQADNRSNLRDHFAGMAMQALLSPDYGLSNTSLVKQAYNIADMMLDQSKKSVDNKDDFELEST